MLLRLQILLMAMLVVILWEHKALAQCNCPTPRPLHATATSGVLTMEYEEEFEAERRIPTRVEVRIRPHKRAAIIGHLQEVIAMIEGKMRESLGAQGFTGELDFQVVSVDTNVNNLTGSGFEFLGTHAGPDGEGGSLSVDVYGLNTFSHNGPLRPGTFQTRVQLRAKVCVEQGDAHLTFTPQARHQLRQRMPETANIPDRILQQKKNEFERAVKEEISRMKESLSSMEHPLTSSQHQAIANRSTGNFETSVNVSFFGNEYQLPIRVSPLQQTRICDSHIGGL